MIYRRPINLVFEHGKEMSRVELSSHDVRDIAPDQTTTLAGTALVPKDLGDGTYALYLELPDRDENLAQNPAYSVRLMNTNVWDAERGLNKLGITVSISAATH